MVVVFNRLNVPGWSGQPGANPPYFPTFELKDALKQKSRGPLLIVGYGPHQEPRAPRLTKSALARFGRSDYLLKAILVDIDYGDHEVPPENWHRGILGKAAKSGLPKPGWYRTPHGMRLFWELEVPVPLERADSACDYVHSRLHAVGIPTDEGTRDWTRMFYSPFALGRDLPHSDFDAIPTLQLDLAELEVQDATSMGSIVNREFPEEVKEPTRRALKPLSKLDSQLADNLYNGELSAPKGKRHETLLKTAMMISFVYESDDPLVPYKMLSKSAVAMGKGLSELWRVCEWTAASFSGHKEEANEARVRALEQAAEEIGCENDDVIQRLILDTGRQFFIWDSTDKSYSPEYGAERQLLGALKYHCPTLAGEAIWGKMSREQIFRDMSSPVDSVVYSHEVERSRYIAEERELLAPASNIDPDLTPTFHEEVEGWLQALFGDHIEKAKKWLAAAPRLDRPVCALYVNGPNSIGKGMLAEGLARIWSKHGEYTDYKEVTGDFQAKMLHCPLVVADEKVPQNQFTNNDSSVFRRLVGNGNHTINRKNMHEVTLKGFPRVLITANNEDALGIREDLDRSDIDAIKLRVGYINQDGDDSARRYLIKATEEAGHVNTYDLTTSWVDGKIAEHVLWLFHNYEYTPDRRFLVEGWHSSFTDTLATSVGSAGIIAETLILAVVSGHYGDAVRWYGGSIFANSNLLAAEWKAIRGHDVDSAPGQSSRNKALKSLAKDQKKRMRIGGSNRRYWEIDCKILAGLAEDQNIADADTVIELANRSKEEDCKNDSGVTVQDLAKKL